MRALAAQGAEPCPNEIPSDLLAANCIPPGFMVQTGWDIVCDYYQARARQSGIALQSVICPTCSVVVMVENVNSALFVHHRPLCLRNGILRHGSVFVTKALW